MAFISQAPRILFENLNKIQQIGPGHYQSSLPSKKFQTVYAPFNSSTKKRTIYDKDILKQASMTMDIGPGSYNVNKNTFIKNPFQAYVNNKSVIVKFNQNNSKQFKSNVPRFLSHQNFIPGPGQYQKDVKNSTFTLQNKKASLQKRKQLKQKVHQFITDLKIAKKISYKPSIPDKTVKLIRKEQSQQKRKTNEQNKKRITTQNIQEQQRINKNQILSIRDLMGKRSKGYTWNKQQRNLQILQNKVSTQKYIGPGKYFSEYSEHQTKNHSPNNFTKKQKPNSLSSNFKSKCIRTFFDTIYYETVNKQIAQLRSQREYKSRIPGPGMYDYETNEIQTKNKVEKNKIFQFFGSTVQRFPTNEQQDPKKHKSQFSSNINFVGKNRSFNKTNHAFLAQTKRQMSFLQKNQNLPGPGQYQVPQIKKIYKSKKGRKVQNFGNSIERFNDNTQPNKNQDPKLISFQKAVRKQKQIKKQPIKESYMFKSLTKKNQFYQNTQGSQLLGAYFIENNDISTKLAKKALFLQNLRQLNIQLPAFNSDNPRFNYQKKQRCHSQQNNIFSTSLNPSKINSFRRRQRDQMIRTKTQKMRDKVLQKNKQQINQGRKSTLYNNKTINVIDRKNQIIIINDQRRQNQRFSYINQKDKKNTPGVGEYSLKKNWNKKSYNIKFNKVKTITTPIIQGIKQ